MSHLPPLALYVHFPWCVRKCPYCDFNSHEAQDFPEEDYLNHLLEDLQGDQGLAQGRALTSIFFGGGTPSLFRAASFARLLDAIAHALDFADRIEVTMEANPGSAEYNNLSSLRQAGVNRLSFGIQSFNDKHLRRLGRIHSSAQARRAFEEARAAGFANINLDLMHGLPEQSPQQALQDLQAAVALSPEHISWYQLTIEPNTVFHKQPPTLPQDDVLAQIQEDGQRILEDAGYRQYEVSAYARPGFEARHNLNYWQFGDYLALGAGAHGKVTRADGTITRLQKTRLPTDYMNPIKPYTASSHTVETDQLPLEFMMNALRLVRGVPAAWFPQRTSLPLEHIAPALSRLAERDLLTPWSERLQATPLGLRFLNHLLAEF